MNAGKQVREGILHGHPYASPVVACIIFGEATSRDRLPILCHGGLFLRDEVGSSRVWKVGDEPEADYGNDNAHNA